VRDDVLLALLVVVRKRIPADEALLRAAEAIYLVQTSPEFAYQR
jgi:hypothetical protein